MSNEKRFVLFVVLMFAWLLGFPYLLRTLGLSPNPPKKPPAGVAGADSKPETKADLAKAGEAEKKAEAGKSEARAEAAEGDAKAKRPNVELVDSTRLVLGSITDRSPTGYRLEVQLEQKGAGIESVTSSRFDAEFEGRRGPHRPLQLIRRDPVWPPSLALTLSPGGTAQQAPRPDEAKPAEEAAGEVSPAKAEDWLDAILWEVVADGQGRIVRPLSKEDATAKTTLEGQEIAFRTISSGGITITKTFRLWQNTDGLEVELKFESPDLERKVAYNLLGPHGIPIEGEWYTGTFRDIFFGTLNAGATDVVTYSAYDAAKNRDKPVDTTALPLLFAGVENQYFATFLQPVPLPKGQDDRWERETTAVVLHKDDKALQKADVGIRVSSKPFTVGPNVPLVHTYRVFAGPKTPEALLPYQAEGLASYRKNQWIPFAPYLARVVIAPTLAMTYQVTVWVAGLFGGTRGNYGIAIILLTLVVRMLMFPLGRKQALAAQKMQELQPHLKELQEKYKEDKERLTKETFGLYKKHGVNPMGGCLPALIQLPIFVGLWQALNSSVSLRHAPFLWISDLAAPDMLFRFPFEIIFLGNWFNLLPIVVVGLMLFQTKLFSPPATTPEAEMQQKTMKYMMVFMAVMFYKVPSGLGLYFITSSLWSIGERLLLPKLQHPPSGVAGESEAGAGKGAVALAGGKSGVGKDNTPLKKSPGRFSQFWEKVLEEARKDSTYRKLVEERDGKDRDRKDGPDDRRDRDRGKPRARPGRR